MKRVIGVFALMVLVISGVCARGGGGVFHGAYYLVQEYTNVDRDVRIVGGYGYGVDRGSVRHGGFGLVIHDRDTSELVGAFGGVISGRQLRTGSLTLSVNLWTGVGYVNPWVVSSPAGVGYFAEAAAEAGLTLLPWFQVGVYGGMQAIGSLDPPYLISSARYAPVLGTRLTWGRF